MGEAKDIDEVMAQFPNAVRLTFGRIELEEGDDGSDSEREPKRVVACIAFSEKGFGFGEITIVQTPRGCFLDTECMSLDRVKRYMAQLIDGAVSDNDQDPERHRLYNEEMRRECGEGCRVCYPEAK